MILGFTDYEPQGRQLARAAGHRFALVDIHRFPDGESKVTLPPELPPDVVFCRSLDHPNEKLVELLLAAETARTLGARHITLVAPYLCYMRQDIAFTPGEAVSQQIIGRLLGRTFDALLTVDPHLHRIDHLDQAIPDGRPEALSCAPALSRFLGEQGGRPLLVGPDVESEQWVSAIARQASLDFVIAEKERLGDHQVTVTLPRDRYRDQAIVLIDDMTSTGRTLMTAASDLRRRGAASVSCLVTHALHSAEAARQLKAAGVDAIWSSDSVAHPSNRVALAPLLASALNRG